MNEPEISKGELVFCSGVSINHLIEQAIKFGKDFHEMFKDYEDQTINLTMNFENSTSFTANIGVNPVIDSNAKLYFHILTGGKTVEHVKEVNSILSRKIEERSIFVIEVNIILNGLTCYKFKMRWK